MVYEVIFGGARRMKVPGLLAAVLVVAVSLVVAASPAHAAAFTVNSSGDGADLDLGDSACDASASRGNQCTLRAAIQEANDTVGADKIRFNIPGKGVRTIRPAMELPTIADPATIDGYTQPGASKNTLAKGTNAKLMIELDGSTHPAANGLVIGGSDTTIRGLAINDFRSGPSSAGNGIILNDSSGSNNVVAGNFIGTNPGGTAPEGNDGGFGGGIVVRGSGDNVIGGTSRAARNLVSGNFVGGVSLASDSNEVSGNLIGTDRTGKGELGNFGNGITVRANDNTISGNTIAFNTRDGVSILVGATSNDIGANSIFANEDLGIDLGNDGPTDNDSNDADEGANRLQNHPVITSATTPASGVTTVDWFFDSAGNTATPQTYTVRFYANPADPGEGKTLVDTRTVTDDSTGLQYFTSELARSVPAGQSLTATATDAVGNTSEFSTPRLVRRQ